MEPEAAEENPKENLDYVPVRISTSRGNRCDLTFPVYRKATFRELLAHVREREEDPETATTDFPARLTCGFKFAGLMVNLDQTIGSIAEPIPSKKEVTFEPLIAAYKGTESERDLLLLNLPRSGTMWSEPQFPPGLTQEAVDHVMHLREGVRAAEKGKAGKGKTAGKGKASSKGSESGKEGTHKGSGKRSQSIGRGKGKGKYSVPHEPYEPPPAWLQAREAIDKGNEYARSGPWREPWKEQDEAPAWAEKSYRKDDYSESQAAWPEVELKPAWQETGDWSKDSKWGEPQPKWESSEQYPKWTAPETKPKWESSEDKWGSSGQDWHGSASSSSGGWGNQWSSDQWAGFAAAENVEEPEADEPEADEPEVEPERTTPRGSVGRQLAQRPVIPRAKATSMPPLSRLAQEEGPKAPLIRAKAKEEDPKPSSRRSRSKEAKASKRSRSRSRKVHKSQAKEPVKESRKPEKDTSKDSKRDSKGATEKKGRDRSRSPRKPTKEASRSSQKGATKKSKEEPEPEEDEIEDVAILVIIGDYFQSHRVHEGVRFGTFLLDEVPQVKREPGQAHIHILNGYSLIARDLTRTMGELVDRYAAKSDEENILEVKLKEIHQVAMIEDAFGVPDTGHPGFAVLDTGASESVGTPQAVQELINRVSEVTGKPAVYSTDTSVATRVAFRLADGSVRHPYSLVSIETPNYGNVSIYVLEGVRAPILLSVREMRRRGMIIDFASNRALVSDAQQNLIELPVTTNGRGHLMLDLAAN